MLDILRAKTDCFPVINTLAKPLADTKSPAAKVDVYRKAAPEDVEVKCFAFCKEVPSRVQVRYQMQEASGAGWL
eukprot:s4641_g3.t1